MSGAKELASIAKDVKEKEAKIEGPEDFNVKKPLWDAQRKLEANTLDATRSFTGAISAYTTILSYDRDNAAARKELASLYYSKWQEAEEQRNTADMAYYEGLVQEYDAEGTAGTAGTVGSFIALIRGD